VLPIKELARLLTGAIDKTIKTDQGGDAVQYVLIPKSVVYNSSVQTTSLAAGANEVITFTPSSGKMWRFIALYFNVAAPSGATSGVHRLRVLAPSATHEVSRGESTYASALRFLYSYWYTANSAIYPTDQANLGIALSRMCWDNSRPAKLRYDNATNVSQTGSRDYKLEVVEEQVA